MKRKKKSKKKLSIAQYARRAAKKFNPSNEDILWAVKKINRLYFTEFLGPKSFEFINLKPKDIKSKIRININPKKCIAKNYENLHPGRN